MERQTIIIDNQPVEAVRIDQDWMVKKYNEFRSTYFSKWSMPSASDLAFQLAPRMLHTYGVFKYGFNPRNELQRVYPDETYVATPMEYVTKRIRGKVWSGKGKPTKLIIRLKTTDLMPEAIYENVLIHEMTHCACRINSLWSGEGHDGWFRKIASDIRSASGGKYIVERYVSKADVEMVMKIRKQSGLLPSGYVVGAMYYDPVPFFYGKSISKIAFWADTRQAASKFISKYDECNGIGFLDDDPTRQARLNGNPSTPILWKCDPDNVQDVGKKDWVRLIKTKLAKYDGSDSGDFITLSALKGSDWLFRRTKCLGTHGALKTINTFNESFQKPDNLDQFGLVYEGFFGDIINKAKEIIYNIGPMLFNMFKNVNDSLFGDEYLDDDGLWTIP